jgi:TusA-related sulfurtransferase
MSKIIDARGMSCPQPQILIQKTLDKEKGSITVKVDNPNAAENIERVAKQKGRKVTISKSDDDLTVLID